jgi:hypothetical protein
MSNSKSRPEKRRRRSIIAFEMIRLDRTATEPLHEQLYRQVRDELKSGASSAMAHLDFPLLGLWLRTGESQDRPLDSRFRNFMPKGIFAQSPGPERLLRTFSPKPF